MSSIPTEIPDHGLNLPGTLLWEPNSEAAIESDIEKFIGPNRKVGALNIVCIGGHPDDPESGCGGTLAKFAANGHTVHIIYLTRGEAGIKEGVRQTTGEVRSSEALQACQLLKSTALFANQIDGETVADREHCEKFREVLMATKPDIVFTHWPLDTHPDHRNAALLTYDTWQSCSEKFALVYYEVMTGVQTHHFEPNCFIDICTSCEQKRNAIYAHRSQNPDRFYPYHAEMEKQRGQQAGCDRAEAFFVVRERMPKPLLSFSL